MRRVRMLTVLVIAVAGAGAVALAAFQTGNYVGQTNKGGTVSFKAGANAVTGFTYSVKLRCDGGRSADQTGTVNRIPIRSDRFSTSGAADVTGRLNGKNASGTLKVDQARIGTLRNCRSGALTWSAKKGGASGAWPCEANGAFNGGDLQVDAACTTDFDAFIVRIVRPATRADTSTAGLRCLFGSTSGPSYTGPMVNCSGQNVRLKSGRVLIRFSDNATCVDADAARVVFLRTGQPESPPFALKTLGC